MKAQLKSILVIMALSALVACQKQKPVSPDQTTKDQGSVSKSNSYLGVTSNNGMLEFENQKSFYDAIAKIEADNNNLSEIDPNDELTGSINFEKQFNYTSLRQKVNKLREEWMSHAELDFDSDPANSFVPSDPLKTLLNENSAVKIGGTIYMVLPNFDVVEIKDASISLYNEVIAGKTQANGIIIHKSYAELNNQAAKIMSDSCKLFYQNSATSYYLSNNRRVKTTAHLINFPFYASVGAESENFKKKSNGNWKQHPADEIGAGLVGNIYSRECKEYGFVNNQTIKYNKKKANYTLTYWNQAIRYKIGLLKATGYAREGSSTSPLNVLIYN